MAWRGLDAVWRFARLPLPMQMARGVVAAGMPTLCTV